MVNRNDRVVLKNKLIFYPANTKAAILAVQELITNYAYSGPMVCPFYYVTRTSIADSLGTPMDQLTSDTINDVFQRCGIKSNEITEVVLRGNDPNPFVFFITEPVLMRIYNMSEAEHIQIVPWEDPRLKPTKNHAAAVINDTYRPDLKAR